MESLTDLELNQWKSDPVTQKIIARMDDIVAQLKQRWYEGAFMESSEMDAYWRGYVNGVHEFLRVETEESKA